MFLLCSTKPGTTPYKVKRIYDGEETLDLETLEETLKKYHNDNNNNNKE